VALPEPRPGLVIAYSYLWSAQHRQGQADGTKERPCAVVLTTLSDAGDTIVTVVPITHTPPNDAADGIELPLATKRRIGLDAGRSWVILTEVNRFVWPGPDLRPISRRQPGRFDYGVLPPKLFREIVARLRRRAAAQRLVLVPRTD
jgi:hypothetical protein